MIRLKKLRKENSEGVQTVGLIKQLSVLANQKTQIFQSV